MARWAVCAGLASAARPCVCVAAAAGLASATRRPVQVSASQAMASSSVAAPGVDYGLPAADDADAWTDLMHPCAGRLQRVMTVRGGKRGAVMKKLHREPLRLVEVIVHCGLHYREVPDGGTTCTAPVPSHMPPLDGADKGFHFFPLLRYSAGSPRSWTVTLVDGTDGQGPPAMVGRWALKLVQAADRDRPLLLCAASEQDALEWQRQLHMRAAPLAAVWRRHVGMPDSGSAVASSSAGSAGSHVATVVVELYQEVRRVLANDVLASVAGVVHAASRDKVYNLAVAAGPLVGVALESLGFALRVFAAARGIFPAATHTARGLDDLLGLLCGHVLPALDYLGGSARVNVEDLFKRLGSLVAVAEVLAGELYHRMRSRRQRVRCRSCRCSERRGWQRFGCAPGASACRCGSARRVRAACL